jgi:hypothetical protein
MSRRPANFTQADVARAIRAAKQAGAGDITIRPDGTIIIGLSPVHTASKDKPELALSEDFAL